MTRGYVLPILAASACTGKSDPPVFPADYASTYTEVRNCRPSVEHGPVNVHVLASPLALDTYMSRTGEFPTGSVLLKEEYAEADLSCAGPIRQWTVMEKLADGSSPSTLDWHWQKVDSTRHTILSDDVSCFGCHMNCDVSTGGYLYTCTMP